MIQYTFSYVNPHRHFIDIEMRIFEHSSPELIVQLPAWRPGRYELGNFAKNIQYFKVFDAQGLPLKFQKITKDTWKISTVNCSEIVIQYNYYANELNAGSTYLDEIQLYVNPINCCLYIPDRMDVTCIVNLEVPSSYKVACSLVLDNNQLKAKNFDELVESPWIASNSLQHNKYSIQGINFHIWFQGKCQLYWNRILKDFKAFTSHQINDFKAFPVSEYHFINQILPYKAYHGVEHTSSTVISLGPGSDLMSDKLYKSLLGVSSHELYHTWNVKQIRPKEMMPYDYSKENYSRMGYLYEGVTTYMGDLYLMRSKVFSEKDFYKTQQENLLKHFHNGGRHNMSLADSSFDTWLDGYVQGVPNRKVSIYTEGALCALMLDIHIMDYSNGNYSLRDLMTKLFDEYATKGKPITEEDYIHELIQYGGPDILKIVESHIYGTKDFRNALDTSLSIVGLKIEESENTDFFASRFGLKGLIKDAVFHVKQVDLNSVSDDMCIAVGDEILAINSKPVTKELLKSIIIKTKKRLVLKVKRRFETIDLELVLTNRYHYPKFSISRLEKRSDRNKMLFDKWLDI